MFQFWPCLREPRVRTLKASTVFRDGRLRSEEDLERYVTQDQRPHKREGQPLPGGFRKNNAMDMCTGVTPRLLWQPLAGHRGTHWTSCPASRFGERNNKWVTIGHDINNNPCPFEETKTLYKTCISEYSGWAVFY